MSDKVNFAFKIVCVDENNPVVYKVLDDVNKDNITEVCQYLKSNYNNFDLINCKWIIIPISKTKN